jgi:hypothetical protein
MPLRMLIVDSRGPSGRHRARSRQEALERITENEYDAIELRTARPGCDPYGLVSYLSGIWPAFFQRLVIRTKTNGGASAEWSHELGAFVVARRSAVRRLARRTTESVSSAIR